MSTTHARIVEICALLLTVFISGFWLARTGRPLHGLPMNLHKFASLAAVVLLVMLVVRKRSKFPSFMRLGMSTTMWSWSIQRRWGQDVGSADGVRLQRSVGL
jgi:hypothetical protein